MPLPKLLRFKNLQERDFVRSREQLSNLIETCGFPLGRWLSPNTRVWDEAEVLAWLQSRPIAYENKPTKITDKHISRRTRKAEKRGVNPFA